MPFELYVTPKPPRLSFSHTYRITSTEEKVQPWDQIDRQCDVQLLCAIVLDEDHMSRFDRGQRSGPDLVLTLL